MTQAAAAPQDWLAEALAMPPERGTVAVQGAAIETRAWGTRGAPGLLLMHGAGAHADWWSFIAPFFAQHYRVAAFSFSGMGGSGWREAYSMDLFAEEAFAAAEATGLYGAAAKPAFAAHSFGGRVLLRCAAGPRGASLACAVAIDTMISPPDLNFGRAPFDARNTRVYPTPEAAMARFRLVPAQPCANPALLDYIARESIRAIDDQVQGAGWTWRFDPTLWDKLSDVPSIEDLRASACPVAAIRGARSALMIPPITDYFDANAPAGTPVVTVPEAHHHLMLDQPLAFVAAMRGPLGRLAAGCAPVNAVEIIPPGRPLVGKVVPPGSKSITNRALLLAGLAQGTSRLTGALKSDDTRWMAEALRAMGVQIEEPDATSFVVTGSGRLQVPERTLFLGNAGTATRFLTAAAALVDGPVVVDGDAHMRKRPIAPLVEALDQLGVKASAPTGCPPVVVAGAGGFDGGRVEIDASLSSQYVSAVMMASACARGPVEVALTGTDIGARGYVTLTLAAMRRFGAAVEPIENGLAWRIASTGYHAADLTIEPDASAATYFWAAEALTGGRIDLGVAPIGFTQPDARAYDLIRMFPRMPAVIEGSQIQDAVPTLAVLAAFNDEPVRFTGIANLRVKECDRVAAVATELSRIRPGLGTEDGDDLIVAADPALRGQTLPTRIQTYADHRIAMSFALAGLVVKGIVILDPGCAAKTFPGYWQALEQLGVGLKFEV